MGNAGDEAADLVNESSLNCNKQLDEIYGNYAMKKLLIIMSLSMMTTMAMADPWKKDKNPNANLSGETVGFYKRMKAPVSACKAVVEEGAGLGLKGGKVLVDNDSWYGQEYKDGPIKLGCFKIHGKLTQLTLTLPTGHELIKKMDIEE